MKFCPRCAALLKKNIIDNKERLCCSLESCGYIFWNNPVPVVAMVVETEQGIILAHNKLAPPGIYSIITGFLESNEDPGEAAKRETIEELGLEPLDTNFIGVFSFSKANQIVIAYHIIAKGMIKLNEELDEFKFVSKDELYGWTKTGKFEVGEWLNRLDVLE